MNTTVILTQPRVPQAARAGVYVAKPARELLKVARVAAVEIDVLSRPNIFGGSPFFAPELAPSRLSLAKKNVQKSPMATPILAQKSGHGACVVSLTAEKQPFPLKSGVHIASVMVTKMDFSVYENLCFFWILMPRGSGLPSFNDPDPRNIYADSCRAPLKIGHVSRNVLQQNPREMRWVGPPFFGPDPRNIYADSIKIN